MQNTENGIHFSIEKDEKEKIRLLKLSADQGNAEAQNDLGACYYNGNGVKQDLTEAAKWFKLSAEQGYAPAQNNLGACYYNGDGIEKDLSEAVRYYRLSAEQNNTEAQFNLGTCYENGDGVEKDLSQAFKCYKSAAEKGNAKAKYNLGACYENGIGVEKDLSKAVKWYKLAAEQGNADAQFNLGVCYYKEEKFNEAAKWFRLSAKQGNADALYTLGYCYENGVGVEKDLSQAVKWYKLAAKKGDADAQFNLGVCCYKEEKFNEAARWFRLSAGQGNAAAQFNLGYCYENGVGVEKDLSQAFKWYKSAAEKGDADALYTLGYCYENGVGVEKDLSQAFKWYKSAAEKGDADAQFNLGCCYQYGEGVEKDLSQAFKWYKSAAKKGDADALYTLGYCYANGVGVEKDLSQAFKFFQRSLHIKEKDMEEYNEDRLEHVIKLALASCYSDYYINNFEQWNNYTKSIEQFIEKNNFGEFNTNYTLEFKNGGSDLGLTIISKPYNKKYFLKIYPYSEETHKEKLKEVEYFKLLSPENSMKVFDLYTDKENGCIIFCSEQALTGKINLFPKFDFEQIKKELEQPKTEEEQKEKKEEDTETREVILEKEQPKILLENNQEFKNLCQFFKIMIYSAMHNLGDIRDTNVLMAKNKQDDKDIRVKLIDFWLGRHGNEEQLPDEIKLIDRDNGQEKEIIMENPFLPKNNSTEESLSQIFLKQCIYLFLLAQSRENFGTITTPTSQGVCNITKDVLKFIQENPEISQILEEKVLEYIEEVFSKIENLTKETEELSSQKPADQVSETTTAASSTTPPLPAQPSCDDTTKLPGTLEQSKKDLKTLLEVRVKILNQFCERYQYIQEQLGKFSQSKITETSTEEVKPLPKAEQQSLETQKDAKSISEFVNPSSAEPTSIVAVAAAASATLAIAAVRYANIISSLAARQVRLEEMRKRIAMIQKRIDGESQTSKLVM